MKQQYSIFYFISSFFLILTTTTFAQNILSLEDSLVFLQAAEMPIAEPQYTFSYTGNMLDLNYELTEQEKPSKNSQQIGDKETTSKLLEELDKRPDDVQLARNIASKYKAANDLSNYRTYLEYAYKQCFKKYKQHQDSFEIVSDLVSLLQEGENVQGVLSILNQYVMDNPKDVRGLAHFALHLSIQGEVQKARHFIEQAYLVDSKYSETYLAAMMCEFTNVLIQISTSMNTPQEDKSNAIKNILITDDFFKKAIANDGPPAAQMSLDAAQIFAIFYRTILSVMDKKISKEVIHITPSQADESLLRTIEKRAKKQLKTKVKNTTFAYQTLCIIEMLRGKTNRAVDIFNNSGSVLESNVDLLRLLSLGYFLQLDYDNAILYLEKVLVIQPNPVDFYTLGRFYSSQNQLEKAYQIFDKTENLNPLDRKSACAKAVIHLKKGEFNKAFDLIDAYPSYLKDDINAFHLNYFTALVTLAQGNKNDAFKRLKAIHAQSEYKEDAEKLLAHFFKPEEEEKKK
jgi:tetratricopeptide (TPR) repeat protein